MLFIQNKVPVIFFNINNENIPMGLSDSPFSFIADDFIILEKNINKILKKGLLINNEKNLYNQKNTLEHKLCDVLDK